MKKPWRAVRFGRQSGQLAVATVGAWTVACALLVAGCDSTSVAGAPSRPSPGGERVGAGAHRPAGTVTVPTPAPEPVSYPRAGWVRFTPASGDGGVLGTAGPLLRFRVLVETDIHGLDVNGFGRQVETILGDVHGWTAGGARRFQRVASSRPYDFTVYLVTPATRDQLCQDIPDGYTSCRRGDSVVLNVSRWVHGVPFYRDLNAYRQYMVGHEVGHRIGQRHQLCPGVGQPAPVMLQQTLGLHGCVPNPWPAPHGTALLGPNGEYDQSTIPSDPPAFFRDSGLEGSGQGASQPEYKGMSND